MYNAKGYSRVDVRSTAQGAHQTRSQERKHVQYSSLVQVVKVVIQFVPVVKQWLQVVTKEDNYKGGNMSITRSIKVAQIDNRFEAR